MPVANGTRLGPYEILAPLGAGGMGEVYTARDTRLGRTVAIKILPAKFASDAKLKIRFEREAKAISALSHPHICALHDVGPGYLVMEYCEGRTLAERLASGPLPLRQVIEYGMQIADALEKAHRAGIIHRDLKPSNIMITTSGVKLLDFGLARQQTAPSPDESTLQQVTEEGTIAGTVQYMAPELFHGKEADARSDIFALGLVLYEMATGKRAFTGASKASLIAAILEHEAPHVEGHGALDRIIRACLEKDPDERLQDAHDVALQLRWIPQDAGGSDTATKLPSRAGWLLLAIITIAAGSVVASRLLRKEEPLRPARFQLQPPYGVIVDPDSRFGVAAPAVSPDGQWVVFGGRALDGGVTSLYVRSTREVDAKLVPGTEGARDPFFSPDSQWLGFFAEGALQKVLVQGGMRTTICSTKATRGATWGDDGTILFSNGQGLMRVSADGGEPRPVTSPQLPTRHYWPRLLPGSKHALITITRGMNDQLRKIGIVSLADGHVTELARGTYARYADGRIIYTFWSKMFALPFDLKQLKVTGKPESASQEVWEGGGSGVAFFDLSSDGVLVFMPFVESVLNAEILWVDRSGQITKAIRDKPFLSAALSPDGNRIAAVTRDLEMWAFDLQRGAWTKMTTGILTGETFAWFPDSRSVVIGSYATGLEKLFRVSADGGGNPQPMTFGLDSSDAGPAVSPDGNTLIFMRTSPAAQFQLMTLSLASNGPPRPFAPSRGKQAYPAFSPDGRWVAYESDETGQTDVHVRPFPAGQPRVTVSVDGGAAPFWSHDGRELFYQKGQEIWSVAVRANGGFHPGPPKRVFTAPWLRGSWGERLQACPDGKHFLAVRQPPEERGVAQIVYAPHWIAELTQTAKEH